MLVLCTVYVLIHRLPGVLRRPLCIFLPLTLDLLSRKKGNFHAFDLDDVDAAFARFKTLKFSQHLTFSVRQAANAAGLTHFCNCDVVGGGVMSCYFPCFSKRLRF